MHKLLLGCNGRGAQHIPGAPPSIDEQFHMVKASGVFDFFDRMPQPGQESEYLRASEKHDLPMLTGLWTCLLYTSPSPRDRQKSRMPSSA